ncbi:MAG TPA: hypothetical protein VEW07_04480, partial [Solirubrobacterales bacterium]|nr:hypothetical protein [Solirubrobacterales bacterium]
IEYEGSSKHVFRAGDNKISCSQAYFEGTLTKASTELTLGTIYSTCVATPGNRQTTVQMNGCDFVLSGGKTTGANHYVNGLTKLECPVGKVVEIKIFASPTKHFEAKALCTIQVSPFEGLTPNTYTNVAGSPADVQIFSRTARLPVAMAGACGTATTGSYEGARTLTAHNLGNVELAVKGGEEGGFSSTEIAGQQVEHEKSSRHRLTLGIREVSCEALFNGTVEASPEKEVKPNAITVSPTYRNCVFQGVYPTTVTTNGCDFLFHVKNGSEGHFTGSMDLKCPAGAVIEFRVYTSTANHEADNAGCRFRLSPKEGLGAITYENTGEQLDDVRITTSLSGIPLEVIGPLVFCGLGTSAAYTGASTVRGYTDEALTDQVDLTVAP